MLAPSNVWLNFSSCIVSGASGVKVPPAIKGSPFFRYCGFRIVDGQSRRNIKRFHRGERYIFFSGQKCVTYKNHSEGKNIYRAANFFRIYKSNIKVQVRPPVCTPLNEHFNRDTVTC